MKARECHTLLSRAFRDRQDGPRALYDDRCYATDAPTIDPSLLLESLKQRAPSSFSAILFIVYVPPTKYHDRSSISFSILVLNKKCTLLYVRYSTFELRCIFSSYLFLISFDSSETYISMYTSGFSTVISARLGYSYIDSNGILQTVTYTADDENGFRVSASNLPQPPKNDVRAIQDKPQAKKKSRSEELQESRLTDRSNYQSNILSYEILPPYFSFANHDTRNLAVREIAVSARSIRFKARDKNYENSTRNYSVFPRNDREKYVLKRSSVRN